MTENSIEKTDKVVLLSVISDSDDKEVKEISLDELERLAETAGAEVFCRMVQNKEAPNPATYIGSGKAKELKELCSNNDIDLVIADDNLSPSQIKNLEDELDGPDVIDRSMLILDIFAKHAESAAGKLQVELAQLKYTVPRLIGKGKDLSRLGGGIGTRGPGESKLETDRRHVKRRIDSLEEKLAEIEKNKMTQRGSRDKSGIFKFGIVGYTNAGKSTLLNRMTSAGVLAEDKLFATLDTTTRKYTMERGEEILLTDTVGLIRNLPHMLVESFKSTLDEIKYSDALLIVIDVSDPEFKSQLEVTEQLISELGANELPKIYVFNKCDRGMTEKLNSRDKMEVYISALNGDGLKELESYMYQVVNENKHLYKIVLPMDRLSFVDYLYKNASVNSVEYRENGVYIEAVLDKKTKGMVEEFIQ